MDIAHALAMKCRYGGHTDVFYSVAEHSVRLSEALEAENPAAPAAILMQGLMHDAAEAYLVDLPRPIKPEFPRFLEIEATVERAVFERFHLQYPWPDVVNEFDRRILSDEMDAILDWSEEDWVKYLPKVNTEKVSGPFGWTWQAAKKKFLDRFHELEQEMK